jgi:uncharacterized protein (TIGR00297 family)
LSFRVLSLGMVLGAAVGWLGYRARALTGTGAVAAAVIGAVIFGFGGLGAAILVIFFFVSSSVLTRFKAQRKETIQLDFDKGGQRDAWQVLANGGLAATCLLLYGLGSSPLALVGFIGAIAVATADTWGTEIGVLSRRKPRSILTGRFVPCGTSGGITVLGTGATILGGLAIGAIGLLILDDWCIVPTGMIAGFLGASFDSMLGASWQVMYFCPICEESTESHPAHYCGSRTEYQRGWRWLNNDGVNFLATVMGAGASVGFAIIWI